MFKSKRSKVVLAAVLSVGAAVGGSQAAFASTMQQIDHLGSPHDYGYTWGSLDWNSSSNFYNDLAVTDTASDGHGPYMHVIISADNYAGQVAHAHATGGAGSSASDPVTVSGHGAILFADVWTCNGGDASGSGTVEDGCNGRRYFNPYGKSPQPSFSLGTSSYPY